jgi:hypothetical protein
LPFSSYPSLLPPSRLSSTYSAEEKKIPYLYPMVRVSTYSISRNYKIVRAHCVPTFALRLSLPSSKTPSPGEGDGKTRSEGKEGRKEGGQVCFRRV